MKSDTSEIITPFEDSFYHPDWRARLIQARLDDPGYKHPIGEAMRDATVRKILKFNETGESRPQRVSEGRGRYHRVRRWGEHDAFRKTGHIIDALLLTDAPLEAIATDFGCDQKDLILYARLYFDVRTQNSGMDLAPAQKQFFATEGGYKPTLQHPEYLMWRRVAVSAGYTALIRVLELGEGSWADAPRVDIARVTTEMAKTETFATLASGRMSTAEVFKLDANRLKEKLIRHTTGEANTKDEGMELALQFMQLTAPKMVEHDRIRQAQAAKAAESMAEAERAIEGADIEDMGRASADETLRQALLDAAQPLIDAHEKTGTLSDVEPGLPMEG